jgi:YHS domain-containing protein
MSRITGSLDEGRVTFGTPGAEVTDPVCGKKFERLHAVAFTDRGSDVLYFCSHACKQAFDDAAAEGHPRAVPAEPR